MVPVAQEMESLRKERDQLLLRLQQLEQDGQARAILALVFLGAFFVAVGFDFFCLELLFFQCLKMEISWTPLGFARHTVVSSLNLRSGRRPTDGNGRGRVVARWVHDQRFTIFQFLGDRLGHSSIGSSFNPPKMGNRSYVYIYIIVLWDRQM